MFRLVTFMLAGGMFLLAGSSAPEQPHTQVVSIAQTAKDKNNTNNFPVTFVDVASLAGLNEQIIYGGVEQKRYIIETNGCGVAFIDYDNDGWMDLFLLNGTRLEGSPASKQPASMLYHNNRDG